MVHKQLSKILSNGNDLTLFPNGFASWPEESANSSRFPSKMPGETLLSKLVSSGAAKVCSHEK